MFYLEGELRNPTHCLSAVAPTIIVPIFDAFHAWKRARIRAATAEALELTDVAARVKLLHSWLQPRRRPSAR